MSIREIVVLVLLGVLALKNLIKFFACDFNGDDCGPVDAFVDMPIVFYPLGVIYAMLKPIPLCAVLYLIFC